MLVAKERIFADHYQFYLFDSRYEHFSDPKLEWTEDNRLEHGYLASDKGIYVSTVSDLNDHRVRVYLDEDPRINTDDKVFIRDIQLESGVLKISAISNLPEDDVSVTLEKGFFTVTVVCRNAGVDLYTLDPEGEYMEDEAYLALDEFEHYDIFLKRTIYIT